jgi:hypothetical protein
MLIKAIYFCATMNSGLHIFKCGHNTTDNTKDLQISAKHISIILQMLIGFSKSKNKLKSPRLC